MVLSALRTSFAAVAGVLSASAPLAAQTPEQFYAGRTVNLIVPSSPGGAYDISARLVSRHLGRHIPGKPSIVVQNQSGGAAGIVLANRFASTPERDGTLIAGMLRSVPQFSIMGDPNAKFDPATLEWLGSISSFATDAYPLILNASSRAKSVADLAQPGPKTHIGANRTGSTNLTFGLILRDVYKYNVDVVRGFAGISDVMLAQQRGEVDGTHIDFSAVIAGQKDLWAAGKLKAIIQFARKTPHPQLPGVPLGRELLTDPKDRALVEFAELPFFIGFPFVAPAGTQPDRVAALRLAFDAMAKDAAFIDDARRIDLPISPVDAAEVRRQIELMAATPKDVVERFKRLLEQQ